MLNNKKQIKMKNYKIFTATNKKGAHIEVHVQQLQRDTSRARLTAEIHHTNGKSRTLIDGNCFYNDSDIIDYLKYHNLLKITKH